MKINNLFFAILLPLALAKAPLLHRDVPDPIRNEYIVVLNHDASTKQKSNYISRLNAISRKLKAGGEHQGLLNSFEGAGDFHAVHFQCDEETLDKLLHEPIIKYAAPNAKVTAQHYIPRTEADGQELQFTTGSDLSLGKIAAQIARRNPGITNFMNNKPQPVRAYMLDTGVRVTHQEFGGRAEWGTNTINDINTDDNGHGTHTAGTVGGNTVGVDNTTNLVAVKCLDKNSSGTWASVINAVTWAVKNATERDCIERSVINMSIGGPPYQAMDDAVRDAFDAGMQVVVAACNDGKDACQYSPARQQNATTVGAIDDVHRRADWSNQGACVDYFAPGVNIRSAFNRADNDYEVISGTSMASPHVAGVYARLMASEGVFGALAAQRRLGEIAIIGNVTNIDRGTPNRMLQ